MKLELILILLTLLKFLSQDNKFTYIASGLLLGVTLSQTTSIPMGSIRKVRIFPLDFEKFLYANGINELAISSMRKKFERFEALDTLVKGVSSFSHTLGRRLCNNRAFYAQRRKTLFRAALSGRIFSFAPLRT